MSIIDFKRAWEEALHLAALASRSNSELTDRDLSAAAGIQLRSDLKVGNDTVLINPTDPITRTYRTEFCNILMQ